MATTISASYETPAPSRLISALIFIIAVGSMGYLRLHLYAGHYIALTYGLPLLICLWHQDRVLLWAMAGALGGMATYKALMLLPESEAGGMGLRAMQLIFQIANIVVIAAVVHLVMDLMERLRMQNWNLERSNEELAAREEEITRQNEELQVQGEELAQQNEELQQQSEEMEAQSEELQLANEELKHREAMLQTLLESLRLSLNDVEILTKACESALQLLGGAAAVAAVVEKEGDELLVLAQAGSPKLSKERMPFARSFTSVVIEQDKTAFVDDLKERPDLRVQQPEGKDFRSVLASPLRLGGKPAGAIKLYSELPRQWTVEQFRIVEWFAAQCSLVLEVRRLHHELKRANTNLEALVRERTGKLQELVDELEHFSYSITHDMRAPLRAMQGFAGILSEECGTLLDEPRRDYLNRIITAAGRMDQLITDALSYSKSVSQKMTLAKVDTNKLLRGIIESYPEFQLPRAHIEIQDRLPPVLANEAGLTQCFSNLLTNAVKFIARGQQPRVKIWAERNGHETVRLWFEDSGIGIPPEMLPKIFGMFQRASRAYEGTGIGLALVRKVTERMGGKVGVESKLGKGSRFWLELKLAK